MVTNTSEEESQDIVSMVSWQPQRRALSETSDETILREETVVTARQDGAEGVAPGVRPTSASRTARLGTLRGLMITPTPAKPLSMEENQCNIEGLVP